jgi:hypothetical protein
MCVLLIPCGVALLVRSSTSKKAFAGGPQEKPTKSECVLRGAICSDVKAFRPPATPDGVDVVVPVEDRKNCEKLNGRELYCGLYPGSRDGALECPLIERAKPS